MGGAKACKSCRSRRELSIESDSYSNEYLVSTCKIWLRCSRERAFGKLEFGREFRNLDRRKFLFQFPNFRGNWRLEVRGQPSYDQYRKRMFTHAPGIEDPPTHPLTTPFKYEAMFEARSACVTLPSSASSVIFAKPGLCSRKSEKCLDYCYLTEYH